MQGCCVETMLLILPHVRVRLAALGPSINESIAEEEIGIICTKLKRREGESWISNKHVKTY